MKAILLPPVLEFTACAVLCGCRTDSNPATGYVTPAQLVSQIQTADHIVVKRLGPNQSDFRTTITGPEVKGIIYAIASARHPAYDGPSVPSSMLYDWQLQFYRGVLLLGSVELGYDMFQCGGDEYHSPWTLRRLYHHVAKASGEDN